MLYRLLILLHLTGVTLFFGNFILAFFWVHRADRSGDPTMVALTFRGLMVGDRWLTSTAVLAIVASGIGTARISGLSLLSTGWIFWSLLAFTLSGIVYLARVLPLQRALAVWTAAPCGAGGFDWPRYQREGSRWSLWAHTSFACVLAAFVLMILKPALPGLRTLLRI